MLVRHSTNKYSANLSPRKTPATMSIEVIVSIRRVKHWFRVFVKPHFSGTLGRLYVNSIVSIFPLTALKKSTINNVAYIYIYIYNKRCMNINKTQYTLKVKVTNEDL